MYRNWFLAGSGLLALGLIGGAIVSAEQESKGTIFIAGDKPVSEEQVRQKLQADGWSNVQIAREGRYLAAAGSKDGQAAKVTVDSQTGRLPAADDDD